MGYMQTSMRVVSQLNAAALRSIQISSGQKSSAEIFMGLRASALARNRGVSHATAKIFFKGLLGSRLKL